MSRLSSTQAPHTHTLSFHLAVLPLHALSHVFLELVCQRPSDPLLLSERCGRDVNSCPSPMPGRCRTRGAGRPWGRGGAVIFSCAPVCRSARVARPLRGSYQCRCTFLHCNRAREMCGDPAGLLQRPADHARSLLPPLLRGTHRSPAVNMQRPACPLTRFAYLFCLFPALSGAPSLSSRLACPPSLRLSPCPPLLAARR